jgi:hypothetical protein
MAKTPNEGRLPELVDRVGADLLDHLLVCRQCFRVFAAQQVSIEQEGCEIGRRLTHLAKARVPERPKQAKKAHA